jgi:DNA-binding MarR family transcriptional regulator
MDRTTLGRNILPLERDRLITITPARSDRRMKELRLTAAGESRLDAARPAWIAAQRGFEAGFGAKPAAEMRGLLPSLVKSGLVPADEG